MLLLHLLVLQKIKDCRRKLFYSGKKKQKCEKRKTVNSLHIQNSTYQRKHIRELIRADWQRCSESTACVCPADSNDQSDIYSGSLPHLSLLCQQPGTFDEWNFPLSSWQERLYWTTPASFLGWRRNLATWRVRKVWKSCLNRISAICSMFEN